MDNLKINSAGSMSSLVSDQASNESIIESLQLEDTDVNISIKGSPNLSETPLIYFQLDEILSSLRLEECENEIVENLSIQDVLNSIDALESDRESNLGDLNFNPQPKQIHSILRQYQFQGVSSQISSAAVSLF